MFHRIYESMELGMHPASLDPRRNRFAPLRRIVDVAAARRRIAPPANSLIVRSLIWLVKRLYRLELSRFQA